MLEYKAVGNNVILELIDVENENNSGLIVSTKQAFGNVHLRKCKVIDIVGDNNIEVGDVVLVHVSGIVDIKDSIIVLKKDLILAVIDR